MQTIQTSRAHATTPPSRAEEQARANYAANLAAIQLSQPGLPAELDAESFNGEWLFARDGSLTAMEHQERWWGGCSLPLRAAKFMLKSMCIADSTGCFLSPVHAAQVRVALELLEPRQAVVALVPELRTLWVMLHCNDFSAAIASNRLWFAATEQWEAQLAELLFRNDGLPTPSQFVRPILADSEPADRLIGPAQRIFAQENGRRTQCIRDMAAERKRSGRAGPSVCAVAPSQFRLWDDAAMVLWDLLIGRERQDRQPGVCRFDPDDPGSASSMALGRQLSGCDAVVSANAGRADFPDVSSYEIPWITWLTQPRIPAVESAGPRDLLIAADPAWAELARRGGWPTDRVQVARWPVAAPADSPGGGFISIIADTCPLEIPERVREYSSHGLLWELIESELLRDPFILGTDVDMYLDERMRRLQIAEHGFDRNLFMARLIVPAYQQALARLLIACGAPVRLWGKGWDKIGFFEPHSAGTVADRDAFDHAVNGAAALVHVWPDPFAHPIGRLGRPVLRPFGQSRARFTGEVRQAIQQIPAPKYAKRGLEPGALSKDMLLSIILRAV